MKMARHTDNAEKSNEVDSTTDRVQRRRMMKHMVEKRRRNRINDCLENMRILVLKAQNKNPENYTKMEKADILEMTTNFLYVLNQQKTTACATTASHRHSTPSHHRVHTATSSTSRSEGHSSTIMGEYLKGFSTCQADVTNYIQNYGARQSVPATTRGFPAMVSPQCVTSSPMSALMGSPHGVNLNLMKKSAFRKPEATSTCTKLSDKDVNSNQRDYSVSTTSQDHVTPVNKRRRSDSDVHLYMDSFDRSTASYVHNASRDYYCCSSSSSSKLDESCSKEATSSSSKVVDSMEVSHSSVAPSSSCSDSSMWRPW